MTEQEIMELLREHLPKLVQENPQVREWVRELVAQYGVTREEWNALLNRLDRLTEAIEQLRDDFRQSREVYDRAIAELHAGVNALREEIQLLRETYDRAINALWEAVQRLEEEIRLLRETHERVTGLMQRTHEQAVSELRQAIGRLEIGLTQLK